MATLLTERQKHTASGLFNGFSEFLGPWEAILRLHKVFFSFLLPQLRVVCEGGATLIAETRFQHGRFLGTMAAAGLDARQEAELSATTDNTMASSAIEGEMLPPASVRSSIARRLGFANTTMAHVDPRVEGMADIMLRSLPQCHHRFGEPVGARRKAPARRFP
jgi:hypothetical protein